LESTCAKALSKLDPMALFYSGTLAPIYTGIDTPLKTLVSVVQIRPWAPFLLIKTMT
jgi:hypothetical protein